MRTVVIDKLLKREESEGVVDEVETAVIFLLLLRLLDDRRRGRAQDLLQALCKTKDKRQTTSNVELLPIQGCAVCRGVPLEMICSQPAMVGKLA
jgi:hypothetical protein